MKTTLTPQDKYALVVLDWVASKKLQLMQSHPEVDQHQLEAQNVIGKMRAEIVGCGCKRPSSCGSCRSIVEDEVYWSEKIDDILDEAISEDRINARQQDNE